MDGREYPLTWLWRSGSWCEDVGYTVDGVGKTDSPFMPGNSNQHLVLPDQNGRSNIGSSDVGKSTMTRNIKLSSS